ncbi:MAG: hypothetical protein ACJASV_001514 [Pseudorhodobacter sp.]|jgi:hypothetical protein
MSSGAVGGVSALMPKEISFLRQGVWKVCDLKKHLASHNFAMMKSWQDYVPAA